MVNPSIFPIDLNFQGRSGTIGAYLVPHASGCILFETGPGSTQANLVGGLRQYGYKVEDVTDVYLTHIHLDHAGAAGWLAHLGARIHVHRNGAPHLINPERLLSSAQRLYGELMDRLWGEFLPVPEDKLVIVEDEQIDHIGNVTIRALDVPGHANHHLIYLVGDACFSGDVGGIRLGQFQYVRLPTPPPEFHLENWMASILRIQQHMPKRIVPTHFGVYSDADWHLAAILDELKQINQWLELVMVTNPTHDEFHRQFIEYQQKRAQLQGMDKSAVEAQQIANPSVMSADGILRYWNKYRKST
jgi:glyoxylase-like metal-dependent hydrolase (beta-lactamase superfamily II)